MNGAGGELQHLVEYGARGFRLAFADALLIPPKRQVRANESAPIFRRDVPRLLMREVVSTRRHEPLVSSRWNP